MGSLTGLQSLETSIHKTNDWLNELATELGISDKHQALDGLRSSLHVLRDRLPVDSTAHLAAQLPTVIRGLYFEGWKPAHVPKKVRDKDEFLTQLRQELSHDELGARVEDVARATFKVLARHISEGEAKKISGALPKALRELWPSASV